MPVFGFVAASANELAPLLGFLVKATRANQSAPFLANLHSCIMNNALPILVIVRLSFLALCTQWGMGFIVH